MKTTKQNKQAFTLLELLVTLFIISIIISLSVIVYDVAWSKSRDSKRVSDIIRIQNALESYHQQENKYPDTITFGEDLTNISSSTIYMLDVPQNPSPRDDGDCADHEYEYGTSTDLYGNENFYLQFCISHHADQVAKGINCATSQGITLGACNFNNLSTGLKLWLKADGSVINRFASSSYYVSQWTDASGNGNNVSQDTIGLQPTLIASSTNSRPAVRFDGIDDYLNGGDILKMGADDWTMYVIGKSNTVDGTFVAKSLYGGTPGRYGLLYEGGRLTYVYHDNSSVYNVAPNRAYGSYEILTTEKDGALGYNRLYANNTQIGTTTIPIMGEVTSSFPFLVGAYNNASGGTPPAAGYYLNGDINEILIYNRLLTASEKEEIFNYLHDKYGI